MVFLSDIERMHYLSKHMAAHNPECSFTRVLFTRVLKVLRSSIIEIRVSVRFIKNYGPFKNCMRLYRPPSDLIDRARDESILAHLS